MPDPSQPPAFAVREIMETWHRWCRGELQPPPPPETESLAALGYDGSHLRRRYWKKVTER